MMEETRLDMPLRAGSNGDNRRGIVRSLGAAAVALLAGLGLAEGGTARKKKRKKKQCPPPPPPPPPPPAPPFCAGKNECVVAGTACQVAGEPCFCFARADAGHIGESFCGRSAVVVNSCVECVVAQVCVVTGGNCGGGFACVMPCPNPR